MKKLLALTALGLFTATALQASAAGGPRIPRPMPPDIRKLDTPGVDGLVRLRPAQHVPMSRWDTSGLPRWQVSQGDRTYFLVFDGNKKLEQLVEENREVWWWKVRGRVEQRNFVVGRLPGPNGGPVPDIGLVVRLTVLVVDSLETTPLESIRPT
jgi:hypothetical protein